MQNFAFRTAGIYDGYNFRPDGSVLSHNLTPSSARKIQRTQTSYTGKRVKSNPLPVHPYSFLYIDLALQQDYYQSRNASGFRSESSGPCLSASNPALAEIPWTTNEWLIIDAQALDALNDKTRGDLDLSVDIVEAHQVRKMFNATARVEEYARSYLSKSAKYRSLKALANHWLEFTYGVKPLVSSVFGAANESIRHVLNKTERFTGRASAYQQVNSVVADCVFGSKTFTASGRIKHSVTYGVDIRTQDFDLSRWSSLNPVSIAWETLPYSFVADWFLNVGGYLRNLETSLLYASRFRSGYRTALSVGDVSIKHSESTGNASVYERQAYTGSYKVTSISRTVLSTYPSPRLPVLNARLGSSRLVSAASLLTQLLPRR